MRDYLPENGSEYAICESCGEILPRGATFCPNCGSRRITRGGSDETELPYQYGPEDDDDEAFSVSIPQRRSGNKKTERDFSGYDEQELPYDEYDEYDEFRKYEIRGKRERNERLERRGKRVKKEKRAEDNALPVPMIGALAAVVFLAAVLLTSVTGLIIASFSGDAPTEQQPRNVASDTAVVSSDTSSQAMTVHRLPDDTENESLRKYPTDGNKFDTAMASSYISEKTAKGTTDLAFDSDPNTSWQDGIKGYGEGEWLLAYNSGGLAEKVSEVTVYNGYQNPEHNTKTKDMYMNNSRVCEFVLEFDDGTTETFTLKDEKGPQTFIFNERETCFVRFTVKSVYKGKKYKDTCVSEIIYK